jgi:hypothetical protein
MRLLNRTLTVLILAIAVVLLLGWVARTDWAAARDVLGAGEGFSNAIQPLIRVAVALLVSVSGIHLIRGGYRRVRNRYSANRPSFPAR